ncbi:hypothetical protein C8J57DRAFT_1229353 [Mycena rebaudengoi]|nr:hypothetical protein C8J57DRAFT_1229353 [Mycena rebaudengoi]
MANDQAGTLFRASLPVLSGWDVGDWVEVGVFDSGDLARLVDLVPDQPDTKHFPDDSDNTNTYDRRHKHIARRQFEDGAEKLPPRNTVLLTSNRGTKQRGTGNVIDVRNPSARCPAVHQADVVPAKYPSPVTNPPRVSGKTMLESNAMYTPSGEVESEFTQPGYTLNRGQVLAHHRRFRSHAGQGMVQSRGSGKQPAVERPGRKMKGKLA